jgi:hypothetical protein
MARQSKTTEQKLRELKTKLDGWNANLALKRNLCIGLQEGDDKLAKLQSAIEKLQQQIKNAELKMSELILLDAEEKEEAARIRKKEMSVQLLLEQVKQNDPQAELTLLEMLQELEQVTQQRKALGAQADQIKAILRRVGLSFPDGWTVADEVEKMYQFFFVGDREVLLQANPSYLIDVADVVKILGARKALEYMSVNRSALLKAIEAGGLKDTHSRRVTLDRLDKITTRSLNQPTVRIKNRATTKDEFMPVHVKLFIVDIGLLADFGATDRDVTILLSNGLEHFGDLIKHSGESLLNLRGVGPTIAKRVTDAAQQLVAYYELSQEDESE